VTVQTDPLANSARRPAVRERASRQTIADVAREAGVSTASVSRTLSGTRPVTQATATAVREASDRLGFRANKVARALRVQSTHTIGLVVPNIIYPFFPQLIQAVETELRIDGRGLLLADSLNDATLEAERVEDLLDRQVDGLIVIPCHRHESQSTLLRASRQTNVVQLDREASPQVHFVGMDHALAMRILLEHLYSTGRKRFAYLGANPSSSASHERQVAYLRHFKGTADATRVLLGDFSFDWGVEGALRAMQAWPEVDAIVCGNDLIAVGALHALGEAGLDAPRQVAITGFDDSLHPLMRWPAPTTIRQPLQQMAVRALSLLSHESRSVAKLRLPGELIVRDSSLPRGPGESRR
jgi:LacI family transcriptional regulator